MSQPNPNRISWQPSVQQNQGQANRISWNAEAVKPVGQQNQVSNPWPSQAQQQNQANQPSSISSQSNVSNQQQKSDQQHQNWGSPQNKRDSQLVQAHPWDQSNSNQLSQPIVSNQQANAWPQHNSWQPNQNAWSQAQNTVWGVAQAPNAQSASAWQPSASNQVGNQNTSFQWNNVQKIQQPFYKEDFGFAPPTDDSGNPIEAQDLIKIKQQEFQQKKELFYQPVTSQQQPDWSQYSEQQIHQWTQNLQKQDEDSLGAKQNTTNVEEEKIEPALQLYYSSDNETCWYQNNTSLIYVFATKKWVDRRDYLIENPQKLDKHKKFISEKIKTYIKQLLDEFKAQKLNPAQTVIQELSSWREETMMNTLSKEAQRDYVPKQQFKNNDMEVSQASNNRDTISIVTGPQIQNTGYTNEQQNSSNTQIEAQRSIEEFSDQQEAKQIQDFLQKNQNITEKLKSLVDQEKLDEKSNWQTRSKMNQTYQQNDQLKESWISTRQNDLLKSIRELQMEQTLRLKEVSIDQQPLNQNIRLEFKAKLQTKNQMLSFKAKASQKWQIENFESYSPVQPFNVKQMQPLQQYGKEGVSKFERLVGTQLLEKGFTHFRQIRGDGNCFYRSVMISYLEIIAMNENYSGIIELAEMIAEDFFIFDMRTEEVVQGLSSELEEFMISENIKETLCGNLVQLAEEMRKEQPRNQIFKYIQRLFLTNDLFDKSAVFFLRKLLYNFMKHETYSNFQIEGLTIQLAACVEETTYQDYLKNIVLAFGRDAQGILIQLLSIVLRVNISVVDIDSSMKDEENQKYTIQEGKSIYDYFSVLIDDSSLNLHKETIYVIRKENHYNSLYSQEGSKQCNLFQVQFLKTKEDFYDSRFIEKIQQDDSDLNLRVYNIQAQNAREIESQEWQSSNKYESNITQKQTLQEDQRSINIENESVSSTLKFKGGQTQPIQEDIKIKTEISNYDSQFNDKEANHSQMRETINNLQFDKIQSQEDSNFETENSLINQRGLSQSQTQNEQIKASNQQEEEINSIREKQHLQQTKAQKYLYNQNEESKREDALETKNLPQNEPEDEYFLLCCNETRSKEAIKFKVIERYRELNLPFSKHMLDRRGRIALRCGFCNDYMFLQDLQHFLIAEELFIAQQLQSEQTKPSLKPDFSYKYNRYSKQDEQIMKMTCCQAEIDKVKTDIQILTDCLENGGTIFYFFNKNVEQRIPKCLQCGDRICFEDFKQIIKTYENDHNLEKLYREAYEAENMRLQQSSKKDKQKELQIEKPTIKLYCCKMEQTRMVSRQYVDKDFKEMCIEREIDQIRHEVLLQQKYDHNFLLNYCFLNEQVYEFPTCESCGNRITPDDLTQIFPEYKDQIQEALSYVSAKQQQKEKDERMPQNKKVELQKLREPQKAKSIEDQDTYKALQEHIKELERQKQQQIQQLAYKASVEEKNNNQAFEHRQLVTNVDLTNQRPSIQGFYQSQIKLCKHCDEVYNVDGMRRYIENQFSTQYGKILFFATRNEQNKFTFCLPVCRCGFFLNKRALLKLFPDKEELIEESFSFVSKYTGQRVEKDKKLFRYLGGNLPETHFEKIRDISISGLFTCENQCDPNNRTPTFQLGCGCKIHYHCLVLKVQKSFRECKGYNCNFKKENSGRKYVLQQSDYEKVWVRILNMKLFRGRW